MDATIRYEAEGGIACIALARPDKRNAMNAQMFDELADAQAGRFGRERAPGRRVG